MHGHRQPKANNTYNYGVIITCDTPSILKAHQARSVGCALMGQSQERTCSL